MVGPTALTQCHSRQLQCLCFPEPLVASPWQPSMRRNRKITAQPHSGHLLLVPRPERSHRSAGRARAASQPLNDLADRETPLLFCYWFNNTLRHAAACLMDSCALQVHIGKMPFPSQAPEPHVQLGLFYLFFLLLHYLNNAGSGPKV